MARVVLVTFPDNRDAERFVREVTHYGGVYTDPDSAIDENWSASPYSEEQVTRKAIVEAVVAKPVKYCQCAQEAITTGRRRRSGKSRMVGWSRGTRFGWWLCGSCRKPSKAIVTHWITSMLVGANDLLPEILGDGKAISAMDRYYAEGGVGRPELKVGDHYEHI